MVARPFTIQGAAISITAPVRAAIAGAAIACAAFAPVSLGQSSNDPAFANTVLSIEGKDANLLAPMWVGVRKTGTRGVRDSTGQKVRISARSVLSQAVSGTTTAKVPFKWTWYPSFQAPYVQSIGGQKAVGLKGWNYRVNSLYFAKAANNVNLGFGDRVLWYWGGEKDTVLEIAAPGVGSIPGVVVGPGPFTIQVNQVTWKRVRTPAAGATVTFGAASATAAADGTATFGATSGVATIRATRRGAIAATKQLCVEGTNPACGG